MLDPDLRKKLRSIKQRSLIHTIWYTASVADPDPGSGAFLTTGSGMGKDLDPRSFSESLAIIFWV
jgi:hypothetical protein